MCYQRRCRGFAVCTCNTNCFAPDIAVYLNLTPDHIDHHGSFENYAAAKANIFRGEGVAIRSVDDDLHCDTGARDTYGISVKGMTPRGVFVEGGILYDWIDGDESAVLNLNGLDRLRGEHNHQNIANAYNVARLLGCDSGAIYKAIQSFSGLPYRQYLVRTIDNVAYINDSKATNAVASVKALASYDNIYWIAGGQPKEGGLEGVQPYLANVSHVFLIGQAQDEFSVWLKKHDVSCEVCGTMEKAVRAVHDKVIQDMQEKAVVLLSPACASFDQYSNFEERGDDFTMLVNNL